MKTNLFRTIILSLLVLSFTSCEKEIYNQEPQLEDLNKMEVESVWLTRPTSGDLDGFILNIKMKNLSGSKINPPKLASFEGLELRDDGSTNDLLANDLVYSSSALISIENDNITNDDTEIMLWSKTKSNARAKGIGIEIGCDQFCLVGNGTTCCGQKCSTSVLGGRAWFCIGGCGCKSKFTFTSK